ncbi:MAG: hypothetical protein OXF02_03295 [Simkaniaceae bacterium]|nr:hypothetical protein [Simkaniaceae bacterium]
MIVFAQFPHPRATCEKSERRRPLGLRLPRPLIRLVAMVVLVAMCIFSSEARREGSVARQRLSRVWADFTGREATVSNTDPGGNRESTSEYEPTTSGVWDDTDLAYHATACDVPESRGCPDAMVPGGVTAGGGCEHAASETPISPERNDVLGSSVRPGEGADEGYCADVSDNEDDPVTLAQPYEEPPQQVLAQPYEEPEIFRLSLSEDEAPGGGDDVHVYDSLHMYDSLHIEEPPQQVLAQPYEEPEIFRLSLSEDEAPGGGDDVHVYDSLHIYDSLRMYEPLGSTARNMGRPAHENMPPPLQPVPPPLPPPRLPVAKRGNGGFPSHESGK